MAQKCRIRYAGLGAGGINSPTLLRQNTIKGLLTVPLSMLHVVKECLLNKASYVLAHQINQEPISAFLDINDKEKDAEKL